MVVVGFTNSQNDRLRDERTFSSKCNPDILLFFCRNRKIIINGFVSKVFRVYFCAYFPEIGKPHKKANYEDGCAGENLQNCLLSKFVEIYCHNVRNVVVWDVTGCRLQWILRGHATMLMNRPGRIWHVNDGAVKRNRCAWAWHKSALYFPFVTIFYRPDDHMIPTENYAIQTSKCIKPCTATSLVSRGRIYAIIRNKNSETRNVDAGCRISLRYCWIRLWLRKIRCFFKVKNTVEHVRRLRKFIIHFICRGHTAGNCT